MPATNPSAPPLWKRLLFRRLKFLAVVAVLLAVAVAAPEQVGAES